MNQNSTSFDILLQSIYKSIQDNKRSGDSNISPYKTMCDLCSRKKSSNETSFGIEDNKYNRPRPRNIRKYARK